MASTTAAIPIRRRTKMVFPLHLSLSFFAFNFVLISMCSFPLVESFLVPTSMTSTSPSKLQQQKRQLRLLQQEDDNSQQDQNDPLSSQSSTTTPSTQRRLFLSSITAASAAFLTTATVTSMVTSPRDANAVNFPSSLSFFNNEPRKTSLSIISNKANSTSATAIRQPTKEPSYDQDLAAEYCLLELLPTKNKVFRTLEKDILKVSVLREDSDEPPSDETFQEVNLKLSKTLQYFDDQRSKLAPVFNQEDSTVLSIEKATRGEYLLENLRSEISALSITVSNIANSFASNNTSGAKKKILNIGADEQMDASIKAILVAQRRVLRALAEVGELLVESFPYDVPTEGKFSFLPRLLGRAKITFVITRPQHGNGNGNMYGSVNSSRKDQILGNVTILADGFAAPITAGNFVDLSSRGFYTGLPVKAMKKRLGAKPILTMAEDNIVAYDIANTVDRLTGEDSIVQKAIDNVINRKKAQQSVEEEGSSGSADNNNSNTGSNNSTSADTGDESSSDSILSIMPIMGSFNEGFYDPLTAKPRRIPLEIVQYDRAFGIAKLSYESGFSPSNIPESPTSSSALMSVLTPAIERTVKKTPTLLTFDIPGLVAMNHPDKNLNGGSTEFFMLTEKDLKPGRSSLLNGQYAPFGYVVEGIDIMNKLQAGDIISSTYVNEWGKLNLKKIRGTSFANAIRSQSDDES